jgi:hypothetical protein
VEFITAFLLSTGGHEDPWPLVANRDRAFNGCDMQAQAFLFDDEDSAAHPISKMKELLTRDPKNRERILPFFGGEDLNNRSHMEPTRWAIFFGGLSEKEAKQWPDLFEICRRQVTAERKGKSKELEEWPFWQYWRVRSDFWDACRGLDEVLAVSQTGSAVSFEFMQLPAIFGHTVVLFPTKSRSAFCVLQSQVHRIWVSVFSATIKDDLRYNPQDCFDTFPFPLGFEANQKLKQAGTLCREHRIELMIRNEEGLTTTYNHFHTPDEGEPGIVKLRELHDGMDRAVLDGYGWTDIQPRCEFIPEFEDEDDEDENGKKRKKKYRYRWPDEIRDEVLARLLELNRQRALEEGQLLTEAAESSATLKESGRKQKRVAKPQVESVVTLFGSAEEDA